MLEDRDYHFGRTVFSRPVVFTYVFLGANILVYLLMELAGGATDPFTLLSFGAKSNIEIGRGEIWRFITPAFIHIGLLHLAVNSYSLWNIGPAVEKFYGGARFTILYLVSGAGAVFAGVLTSPRSVSAGASGALPGLCGVLVVFGLRNKDTVPQHYRKFLLQNVAASVMITLFLGFQYGSGSEGGIAIDNAAHIGGLVTGALLAAIIPYDNPFEPSRRGAGVYRFFQIGSLVVVVAAFAAVVIHYDGPKFSVVKAVERLNPFTNSKKTSKSAGPSISIWRIKTASPYLSHESR